MAIGGGMGIDSSGVNANFSGKPLAAGADGAIERVDSGSGTVSVGADGLISRQVEIRWLVNSISGYAAAEEAGRELAPIFYNGHRRSDLSCRAVGNGWYEISATYGNAGVEGYDERGIETDEGAVMVPSSISLDTTGGTEHITTAYPDDTDGPIYAQYAATGETAPESYGSINVSGGRVNGIDVTWPAFNWSETWLVPSWFLLNGKKTEQTATDEEDAPTEDTTAYAVTLHDMTGSVNEDDFRIFKPGEVLFLGARFEASRSSTVVPVTYTFSARANRGEFKLHGIGDITVDKKDGWDYLWIVFGDEVSEGMPVKFPRFVYVDQIYKRKKFADLSIGKYWPRFYLAGAEEFPHKLDATTLKTLDDEKRNKA